MANEKYKQPYLVEYSDEDGVVYQHSQRCEGIIKTIDVAEGLALPAMSSTYNPEMRYLLFKALNDFDSDDSRTEWVKEIKPLPLTTIKVTKVPVPAPEPPASGDEG